MLITTTGGIDGYTVENYLGIVTGEAVFGVSVFADIKAGFKDLMGGHTQSYERELEMAKNHAMVEMIKEAELLGAHAVVGVDIDYMEFLGKYFMVVMSGTGVLLKGFKPVEGPKDFVMPTNSEKPPI
ncbi:MAG: YbjQ family protein [Candidatus Ozemobacteraceae bacterium]